MAAATGRCASRQTEVSRSAGGGCGAPAAPSRGWSSGPEPRASGCRRKGERIGACGDAHTRGGQSPAPTAMARLLESASRTPLLMVVWLLVAVASGRCCFFVTAVLTAATGAAAANGTTSRNASNACRALSGQHRGSTAVVAVVLLRLQEARVVGSGGGGEAAQKGGVCGIECTVTHEATPTTCASSLGGEAPHVLARCGALPSRCADREGEGQQVEGLATAAASNTAAAAGAAACRRSAPVAVSAHCRDRSRPSSSASARSAACREMEAPRGHILPVSVRMRPAGTASGWCACRGTCNGYPETAASATTTANAATAGAATASITTVAGGAAGARGGRDVACGGGRRRDAACTLPLHCSALVRIQLRSERGEHGRDGPACRSRCAGASARPCLCAARTAAGSTASLAAGGCSARNPRRRGRGGRGACGGKEARGRGGEGGTSRSGLQAARDQTAGAAAGRRRRLLQLQLLLPALLK
jgi:hypothetical protein